MIIVNTTFYVDETLEERFLSWIRRSYAPACPLTDLSVARILINVEEGMSAFAVRMHAQDINEATAWTEGEAPLLLAPVTAEFGERLLHFITLMESIDL